MPLPDSGVEATYEYSLVFVTIYTDNVLGVLGPDVTADFPDGDLGDQATWPLATEVMTTMGAYGWKFVTKEEVALFWPEPLDLDTGLPTPPVWGIILERKTIL